MRGWLRLAAAVTWAVVAAIAAYVLSGTDAPFSVVYVVGWSILATAEFVAIINPGGGDTISNGVTGWVRAHPWRRITLVAVMGFLLIHWLAGWP